MFTGIIQEIATITKIEEQDKSSKFTIKTKSVLRNKKPGQSIAINGACMTITEIKDKYFTFDASPETMAVTNFDQLKINDEVNLEAALLFGDALDGHLVQGHIDSSGTVQSLIKEGSKITLRIKFPLIIAKYLAFKGAITVNGVSLTITDLTSDTFAMELIPFTLEKTNLGKLKKGDKVNLETDIITRQLEKLVHKKEKETKYQFLQERGFL